MFSLAAFLLLLVALPQLELLHLPVAHLPPLLQLNQQKAALFQVVDILQQAVARMQIARLPLPRVAPLLLVRTEWRLAWYRLLVQPKSLP
jgi:hypothetical protein